MDTYYRKMFRLFGDFFDNLSMRLQKEPKKTSEKKVSFVVVDEKRKLKYANADRASVTLQMCRYR